MEPTGEGSVSTGVNEILNQIGKKLDSAQRKFVPKFGEKSKAVVAEFTAEGKTPASGKEPLKVVANEAQTPSQFKEGASAATLQSTDE